MSNVVSLTGAPTGERKPNALCVAALEELLEMARAGELIGVGVAGLRYDKTVFDRLDGYVGGPEMVGAAHLMAHRLTRLTLGEDVCECYDDGEGA